MNDIDAVNKADEFMRLILASQPGLFGNSPLQQPEDFQKVARAIAALRSALIDELKQSQ